MAYLEIQHISKAYRNHIALRDINFSVNEGSIFGLLGPNGAGKTSLIRILNQIISADSGEILIDNKPLNQKQVYNMGYLPEERGLYKKMKVNEQLLYLAQLKNLPKEKAQNAINMWFAHFNMKGWQNKKVEELSKGMQQKVQFISTVIHNPKLLILDEPFSGFDPINANLIKEEILRLKSEGHTIILSTHNMNSVEELCDDIALIHKSQALLNGNLQEIKKHYHKNKIVVEFEGSFVALADALWIHFELLEKEELSETRKLAVIEAKKGATVNELLKAIVQRVEVHRIEEQVPGINEIFIDLVSDTNDG